VDTGLHPALSLLGVKAHLLRVELAAGEESWRAGY
jgi:hypothetical protein